MKRILLIDDDANLLRVYKHILSKGGFEVITCTCGIEALECTDKGLRFDLIILDLGLPDIDGLRLLEKLRAKTELNSIPIIINSGYSYLKSDFISWLADAFVVKKSDIKELEETIQEILK
jgi:DNA-binding response OmpR family regulator